MLIMCHVQEEFERFFGSGFLYDLAIEMAKHDRVISLVSDIDSMEGTLKGLRKSFVEEVWWSWGYEPEMFDYDDEEQKWVIPISGVHDYTWVPDELRGLEDDGNIVIAGGYVGECLADLEVILDHMGLDYSIGPVYGG